MIFSGSGLLDFFSQYKWPIIFYSVVFFWAYSNRKKFEKQGIALLLRTKAGLPLMDKISEKHRELVKLIGYSCIGLGFVGMFCAFLTIFQSLKQTLTTPVVLEGSPVVLPGLPLQGMGGTVFPLVIGWIAIFFIMVVHEFSHGVVARAHNIRIKSSGIAFFGPILGAFVEPDEKQIKKSKDVVQYSVFSAGPISNLLLAVLVLFLVVPGINLAYKGITSPAGLVVNVQQGFPAYEAGLRNGTMITAINGVQTLDMAAFNKEFKARPGEKVILTASGKDYVLTLAESPEDRRMGYMGIYFIEEKRTNIIHGFVGSMLTDSLKWLDELFFWIWFMSLNLGLINLVPIFITDGAQMTSLAFKRLIKKDPEKVWLKFNLIAFMFLILIILVPFFRTIIGSVFGVTF